MANIDRFHCRRFTLMRLIVAVTGCGLVPLTFEFSCDSVSYANIISSHAISVNLFDLMGNTLI
jgi:hypothetical protein